MVDAAGPGHGDLTARDAQLEAGGGRAPRKQAEKQDGPHLCHVDELVKHLCALCRAWTAQHHDLHPAGHAVAEAYGSL